MMMKLVSSFPAGLSSHRFVFAFRSGMNLRCFRGRDYSSEYPMRYVPKKAREGRVEKEHFSVKDLRKEESFGCYDSSTSSLENPSELKRAWMADEVMGNEKRSVGFLNGEVTDEDPDHEFTMKSDDTIGNMKNLEKDEFESNAACGSSRSKEDAEMVAIKLLAARAYTALELKKKLIGKKFALNTIDAVISDFRIRGLINDGLYAETYSRSRWSSSTWGPRRIKQALLTKGINVADMEKAVNLVFQEGQTNDEENSKHGMSKAAMDHLYAQASKQWLRGQSTNIETRKSRIVRWLQYRGFNWNVISFILKKLESQ